MKTKKDLKTIKIFEAFAGIGAQKKALENIAYKFNYKIESVGQIEWYIDAIIGYIAIHHNFKNPKKEKLKYNIKISNDSKKEISKKSLENLNDSLTSFYLNKSKEKCNNFFDINNSKGQDIPKNIDIFTYSFPCQDLSIQGKQKGMDSTNKTRSSLLWQVDRILSEMKKKFSLEEMPKYLLLENVQNITSKNHIDQYEIWIKKLKKLGYTSHYYNLNSYNFNSPQNRARNFCISIRSDFKEKINFSFPNFKESKNRKKIKDILEEKVDDKFFLNKLLKFDRTEERKTKIGIIKSELIGYTNFKSEAYIYNPDGLGPTLTASGANSRIKIITNNKIRMLSPIEAIRYMGFSKKDYYNMQKTKLLSDNDIIYLAGNSIPIQILEEIFSSLRFGD